MSLKRRLATLERVHGIDKPKVLVLQVPAGASDEQVQQLKQAEMERLGVQDSPEKLIVYLLKFV